MIVASYYTVGWTPLALIALGVLLLCCSKVGRTSRNNQCTHTLATREVRRAVEEPEPGTEQLSMAVPRPRSNGGEHSRPPEHRVEYVVIDGITFERWH